MDFAVFDLEGTHWKNFLIGGYYDSLEYHEFNNFENWLTTYLVCDDYPSIIYAHFGGIYDFMFVIDFLFKQSDPVSIPENFIIQGKKILKFDVKTFNRRVTFIDSSGLFPFSLQELTESFQVEHSKLSGLIDFEEINKYEKQIKNHILHPNAVVSNKIATLVRKLKKYLKYDCIGLYECLTKYSQQPFMEGKLSLTRSGQSFKVFKKYFEPDLPYIPNQVKAFSRKAYYGGRTEIFKPLYTNKRRPLNVYDINSLYPSCMHDFEYPSNFIGWSTSLELDSFSISHCVVKCPPTLSIPILGTTIKGKFTFPTGVFEGHWTNYELLYAVKHGYSIERVIQTAIFDNGGFIFRYFIQYFYSERINTKCPVQKILFKDLMNHLYGRLAINEEREQITLKQTATSKIHSRLDYGDYEIRFYSDTKHIFTYSNPVLSCFVTSYARIRLYEFMKEVDFDVYYCDTDSIFTPRKMKESNELGKMKLEYQLKEACFLLPKSYGGIKNDGSFILKLKGFRAGKENFSHIGFDDLVQTLSGEIRLPPIKQQGGLAGFKTALKKGEILTVLPDNDKQLKAVYDKREIYKKNNQYHTRPLVLNYQEILI